MLFFVQVESQLFSILPLMKPHLSKSTAFRILFALLFAAQLHGQSLPGARSTDWTIAGLRDTTYPDNISIFLLATAAIQ
jgi:hypothetical protein